MSLVTLLLVLVLLGGCGGLGWRGAYSDGPYAGGPLPHLVVVVLVILLLSTHGRW